jgi:hypothetical protein
MRTAMSPPGQIWEGIPPGQIWEGIFLLVVQNALAIIKSLFGAGILNHLLLRITDMLSLSATSYLCCAIEVN